MAISQGKSTRSPSGARNVANHGKRKSELGRDPAETRVDDKNLRKIRTRGRNEKLRLAAANKINLTLSLYYFISYYYLKFFKEHLKVFETCAIHP